MLMDIVSAPSIPISPKREIVLFPAPPAPITNIFVLLLLIISTKILLISSTLELEILFLEIDLSVDVLDFESFTLLHCI